jgi:flagellar biosynthetic protein FliR
MELLVLTFSLVLARVGAFVAVLPLFGGVNVPRTVRATLALVLATVWFGTSLPPVAPELVNQPPQTSWFIFGLGMGREVLLGGVLGYAFGLFQVPARVAGEFLTQELGLSFGAFLDPTGTANVASLTQIIDAFGILLFFGLDGHHLFLAVLDATFARYPVGAGLPGVPTEALVSSVALTEEWGLTLAAPMAICLFTVTFVLTLMARAAPQVNLFSVGFPLRLAAGLTVVFLLLPNFLHHLTGALGRFGELMARIF